MAQRDIESYIEEINIAEKLKADELVKIGAQAYDDYQVDLKSRSHWEKEVDGWTKLAIQVKEHKSYPWPNASNVKFPILATAAMQFSARAYPTLVPSDGKIVKMEVVGMDPMGEKKARATKIGEFMSYQVLKMMEDWEEDMDKLLLILPILGTCFKKTYWDGVKGTNCSRLVLPKDLVVNYWATSLEDAERVTERIEMHPRIIKERQLAGIFRNVELPKVARQPDPKMDPNARNLDFTSGSDDSTPYLILEQHRYLDLDKDGYPEPYIVTFEEKSKTVLRITARYDSESMVHDKAGKLIRIEPIQYYTKYSFIPNPDGGFYDIGFGLLLGSINDSVNTIINQLIDAGSLSNMQAGFIGKGIRIKMGDARFQPGEWKVVNSTAEDLKKQIMPLPVNAPSPVLFQLLGTLVGSAKELASVADIFTGKMPGQNTPATTTMATIEQGMKVFTAIYKRVYRSLTKEFKKLQRLNKAYLSPETAQLVMDEPFTPDDFEAKSWDVVPAADPQATTQQEDLTKAQGLMELLPMGTVNPQVVTMRILKAQRQINPEELLNTQPPPPDPKVQIEQMKAQMQAQLAQQKMELEKQKAEIKMAADAQKAQLEAEMSQMKLAYMEREAQMKLHISQVEHASGMVQQAQSHQQKLQHTEQQNAKKLKEKPKNASK